MGTEINYSNWPNWITKPTLVKTKNPHYENYLVVLGSYGDVTC
jgi:formate-dependent nitrite reductase cytochrome c552 subunit